MKYADHTGTLLPDDTITVRLRPGLSVHMVGLPYDLRQDEADKIIRIITAHATPMPRSSSEAT